MFDLFNQGGPLFMGLLTVIFTIMLATAVMQALAVYRTQGNTSDLLSKVSLIKEIGLFALVLGVLGQMLGLYSAFKGIEQLGAISPAMLAGGLKVSMITTLYGLLIYAIGIMLWLGLRFKLKATQS